MPLEKHVTLTHVNRDNYKVIELVGAIKMDLSTIITTDKTDVRIGDVISTEEAQALVDAQQVNVTVR